MPTENAPRGGNAFYVGKYGKGKGKDKGKGKGKGKDFDKGKRGAKRNRDTDASLSSFASSSSVPPAKHARITSNTCPVLTPEHNPSRPYRYCWFHGWIFSHSSNECKRILKSNDQARLNATSPTSTTPTSTTKRSLDKRRDLPSSLTLTSVVKVYVAAKIPKVEEVHKGG